MIGSRDRRRDGIWLQMQLWDRWGQSGWIGFYAFPEEVKAIDRIGNLYDHGPTKLIDWLDQHRIPWEMMRARALPRKYAPVGVGRAREGPSTAQRMHDDLEDDQWSDGSWAPDGMVRTAF